MSSAGTIDSFPPTTRVEAASWPQSPLEAARSTQTAPLSTGALRSGDLVELEVAGPKTVYAVMDGNSEIGRLTIRPVGFGAFATEQVEMCSQQDTQPPIAAHTSEPAPSDALYCPSGEATSTDGGFLLKRPTGSPTKEKAMEAWLRDSPYLGQPSRLSRDGARGLILRSDETVQAEVRFIRGSSGPAVHGYTACLDAPTE